MDENNNMQTNQGYQDNFDYNYNNGGNPSVPHQPDVNG